MVHEKFANLVRVFLILIMVFSQCCSNGCDLFLYEAPYLTLPKATLMEALPEYFKSVTERTQLNAMHEQLLKDLRLITAAETCRFLTIHSLEFQDK